MGLAAAALAVLLGANALAGRVFVSPFPPPSQVRLEHGEAVEAAGLLALGMRRLAADLGFIRLLLYYGGEDVGHWVYEGKHEGMGRYPEIAPRAERILDLDPYFSYAAEFAAAALAFNMNQPDRALEVLRYGLARDPRNWKYRAYVAAIALKKRGDPRRVLQELEPVADDPGAPTMLRHIVAFLELRFGRREEAIRLYRRIAESRDPQYSAFARRALRELGAGS